ncbi:hypothetical protein ACFQ7O_24050 [Streptomyces sp. NPDC056485]|uniref:hypothetical protein n=1 Tax=Streptomyces sp. NPDC056485 TaxID=3345834 RepID=UPI00368D243A
MSDIADEMRNQLGAHLTRAYGALVTVSLNLPVPVTLPDGVVTNMEAVPAVRRLLEIVEDQPMPEEAQANLFAACAFWLGAEDLFRLLCTEEFNGARAHSCAANLIMTEETLEDVTNFLLGLE